MTIAIAIRTDSAVVFAADSKLTTVGLAGYEQDGSPRWVDQFYDNATKVVHDKSKTLMAMVAGHAGIGRITATDFITRTMFLPSMTAEQQDDQVRNLVANMVAEKKKYWQTTQVSPDQWRGPSLVLCAPAADGVAPRVWRVDLRGQDSEITETLTEPGIRMEGSYDEVFGLMYGFHGSVLGGFCEELGVTRERMWEAIGKLKVLRPIDKVNLWAMPTQDAIEMAVFLASVQVQMDRFLPGPPACGGPIDVMVLHMTPEPTITVFPGPGKIPHHPQAQSV